MRGKENANKNRREEKKGKLKKEKNSPRATQAHSHSPAHRLP